MTDFTFYNDPGHGWLKVTKADLNDLHLLPRDFSAEGTYVQRAGGCYYLEEDCDAPQFLKAWEAKHGRKATLDDVYVENRRQLGLR